MKNLFWGAIQYGSVIAGFVLGFLAHPALFLIMLVCPVLGWILDGRE